MVDVCGPYLGRDEGGQGALGDVAHLVGWPSISINWIASAFSVRFERRTWAGKMERVGMEVVQSRWRLSSRGAEIEARGLAVPVPVLTATSHQTSTPQARHSAQHVCPAPVNWLAATARYSSSVCDKVYCPGISHILIRIVL